MQFSYAIILKEYIPNKFCESLDGARYFVLKYNSVNSVNSCKVTCYMKYISTDKQLNPQLTRFFILLITLHYRLKSQRNYQKRCCVA